MSKTDTNPQAPIMGISRFRFCTDGQGVTTLVGFKGCPNRCKYCLNPKCFEAEEQSDMMTPQELYAKIKDDELYYVATGGGVCFGGGEPLLYSDFIEEFAKLRETDFRITIETSLNVPLAALQKVLPYVSEFIVDIKDLDNGIYRRYTGRDNAHLHTNLQYLCNESLQSLVTIRVPLINGFTTDESIHRSISLLHKLHFEQIERFQYFTHKFFDDIDNEKLQECIEAESKIDSIIRKIIKSIKVLFQR